LSLANAHANDTLTIAQTDNGLHINSDNSHLHLGGYLLVDAIAEDNADRHNRFDLFNAWLHLTGQVAPGFSYKIQFSLDDSSGSRLRDAYINYESQTGHGLRLGHYDVPTLSEHLSALGYTDLAGRSLVDNLTPGRDVGIMMYTPTRDNWFISAGLFNGNGIDANGEDNDNKDIAIRATGLLYDAGRNNGLRLYPDISMTYGKQNGERLLIRSEAGTVILDANSNAVDQRQRLASSLYAIKGSTSLRLDYLQNDYQFNNDNGQIKAGSLLLTHYLTGEQSRYKKGLFQKIKPAQPYQSGKGGGAWQIALRLSYLEIADSVLQHSLTVPGSSVYADDINAKSIGVTWLPHANVRCNATAIHSRVSPRSGSPLSGREEENTLIIRSTLQFF